MSKIKSRTYKIEPNSVIVYRRPKDVNPEEFYTFLHAAAQNLLEHFDTNTIVIGLENWAEMQILDKEQMRKYGWVRKEDVFMFNEDMDMSKYSQEELAQIVEEYIVKSLHPELIEEEE